MKISVVTVALNSKNTITQTIESVLSQTHKDIEYIIIDGGSGDGTTQIIASYGSRISKFISQPDRGIYDAMNKGILLASGQAVGFLNSDDVFYDQEVVRRIAENFQDQAVDCIYGNLVFVSSKDSKRITRRWNSRQFRYGLFEKSWIPAHPSFYCRKAVYERLGPYRTDFKIAADMELMYRFLQKSRLHSRFIDMNFVRMRDNGVSNRGIKSTAIIIREARQAIIDNGGKFNLVKYLFFKLLKIREFLRDCGRK